MPEWLAAALSYVRNLDELVRLGGYAALTAIVFAETGLLLGFFLPGDSLLVTAGLVAAAGDLLNIWVLVPVLCAAAIVGDSVGYAIGYYLGPRIFSRTNSWLFHKDHVTRTERFYQKYGAKTIVLARFVPIVRTFAPTMAGVGKMRYATFLTYNVAGGIGWVVSMTLLGYFLGRAIPDLEHHVHWIALAVIIASFLPIVHEWRAARRARQPGG